MVKQSSFDLFKTFAGELDPEILQKKFLLALLKLQNVQRGSIWIQEEDEYLCIEAAGQESDAVKGLRIDAGSPSIVGWVIDNGRMTVADTHSDSRHYRELEKDMAVKSSQILCFPLFLSDRRVYGAVEIIDTALGESRLNLDRDYLVYLQNLVDIGSVALSNAISYKEQVREKESLKTALKEIQGEKTIVGQSRAFQDCMNRVRSYAGSDFHVLITGESGTGKELVAREIHRLGPRRKKPFLVQNCSALPESLLASELFGYRKGAFSGAVNDKQGLFEAADTGTVFLDEIGDMPLSIQASILRVLQNNEIKPLGQATVQQVDVRIIAATNKNIKSMVAENTFRQDLFYRLSILPVRLPPLRERRDDIPLLVRHFLRQEAVKTGSGEKRISNAALKVLIAWHWPGNIRELENLVKYLMVTLEDPVIEAWMLPSLEGGHYQPGAALSAGVDGHPGAGDGGSGPAGQRGLENLGRWSWEEMERAYLGQVLEKYAWNVTQAAAAAGLNRSTFASRLRRLGIQRPQQAT